MKHFRLYCVLLILTVSRLSPAQTTGFVYDAARLSPLPGAVIQCGSEQTVTASDGSFHIAVDDSPVLVVSHLGYTTDTIVLDSTHAALKIFLVPDYTRLEQITVYGPLFRNRMMELPSSISGMQGSELMQTAGITYIEKLNRLPGVYVQSGSINTNRLTIRGIGSRTPYGSNRVKAYFNDIPLTSGDGATSMEDIDPSMIGSVEVLKGSKSALYGSGLGGIIMLTSRAYTESGLHGKAGFEAGSYGTLNPWLSLHYRQGKFSGNTTVSLARSDGWRQNSSFHRYSLNTSAGISHKLGKTDVLVHIIDMRAHIPSSLDQETFLETPRNAAANWLAIKGYEEYLRALTGIRNELRLSDRLRNTTVVYVNYYEGYESRPFNILADDGLQSGAKSTLHYEAGAFHFSVSAALMLEKYNWQIYETLEGVQGGRLSAYHEIRQPLNLVAHGAWKFENGGSVEGALSYNFLSYRVTDQQPDSLDRSGDFRYAPVLSPFLGINLPVHEQLKVYASAGHGFSYPTVEETLLPDGQLNPGLRPESGITMEVGTRLSALGGNLFADAGIYLMLIDDLLVTERPGEDIFTGKNAGKTRHMGFEFQSELRLNPKTPSLWPQTRLNLSLTLSSNTFTDFTDDGNDHTGRSLPGVPAGTLYAGATFTSRAGLYAHLSYNHTGSQYLDDANTLTYPAYSIAHLKLGYRFTTRRGMSPELWLGIQNLFDRHYASMLLVNATGFGANAPRYYYPGQPRSFYAGVMVGF
jgi:iron complex outermembrane receptor protein